MTPLPHYPWSLILTLFYVYLLIVLYALKGRWTWVYKLYSRRSGVISLGVMTLLLLIFGLVPQNGSGMGLSGFLGFHRMNRSPVFLAAMLVFTTVISLKAIDGICHFKRRRIFPVLSHIAVSAILIAALFLSGDKRRVVAVAYNGNVTTAGYDKFTGEEVRLPFSIKLEKFSIEGSLERPSFLSEIEIFDSKGRVKNAEVTVNHPFRTGSWRIYQAGYDTSHGMWSRYSVLECVKDPLSGFYTVMLWLLMASGVGTAVSGRGKSRI